MTSAELKIQFKHLHWTMPDWGEATRFAKDSQGRRYRASFERYRKHVLTAKAHEASKLAEVAVSRNPNAKSVMDLRDLISDIRLLTTI